MALEKTLQALHEAAKPVEISSFWDNGFDVTATGEERNFREIAEVAPWLQHWFGLDRASRPDALATELQKIYDSEMNVTIRTGDKTIFVGLGNEFTGFEAQERLSAASRILPWLQDAIHKHIGCSKYDVERLGGVFTDEMAKIRE